jgi:hypothetical protein
MKRFLMIILASMFMTGVGLAQTILMALRPIKPRRLQLKPMLSNLKAAPI